MVDNSSTKEGFEYSIEGVPFIPQETYKDALTIGDALDLIDANPNKYLIVYSVEERDTGYYIHEFACASLKDSVDTNHLLSYPCSVNTYITTGIGKVINKAVDMVEYGGGYIIAVEPGAGWTVNKIMVNDVAVTVQDVTVSGKTYKGYEMTECTVDSTVKVELTATS